MTTLTSTTTDVLTVTTVARALLDHPEVTPAPTAESLHSLCFLAQGWSLAQTGRQLFNAPCFAGKNGPLVLDLRAACKPDARKAMTTADVIGPEETMSSEQARVVDRVATHYGTWPQIRLTSITDPPGGPCARARELMEIGTGLPVIDPDTIRSHFTRIASI